MLLGLKTVEWAQVLAPVFSAVAAGASWASVRQARRSFDESRQPRLVGGWSNPGKAGGDVTLRIYNSGTGWAQEARFYAVSGSKYARGLVGRVVRPAEGVRILAPLPPHDAQTVPTCILICQDVRDRWHVWSLDGRHTQLRTRVTRRPVKEFVWEDALTALYPDAADATREPVESRSVDL